MADRTPAPSGTTATAKREKALRSGIVGSLAVRAVALVAPLVLIPINLDYLGPALFGLWATLTAVTAVSTFSDLGMGNGLLTLLPGTLARGETHEARALVSSAYGLLSAVSLGALGILLATFPFVEWNALVDPDHALDRSGVRLVLLISLAVTAIAAPLSLCLRLFYALQRGQLAAIWTSAVILAPLVPVLVGVQLGLSPYAIVVLLIASGPVIQLIATMWLFLRVAPELRPHPRLCSVPRIRRLFRLGALFLVLSVTLVLATSLDNLVLAHSVGLAAVTAFAIPAKVFAQLAQAITWVNLPLWAANGDAMARGDALWVRRTTVKMVALSSGVAAVVGLAFVVVGPAIMRAWLGRPIEFPLGVLLGLALATTVTAALSPLFMVQNAAGVVVPQIIGWGAFAILTGPPRSSSPRPRGVTRSCRGSRRQDSC